MSQLYYDLLFFQVSIRSHSPSCTTFIPKPLLYWFACSLLAMVIVGTYGFTSLNDTTISIVDNKGWINQDDVYVDICGETLWLAFATGSVLGLVPFNQTAQLLDHLQLDEIVHLCWIDNDHLAVSYTSGFVRVWNRQKELVLAQVSPDFIVNDIRIRQL